MNSGGSLWYKEVMSNKEAREDMNAIINSVDNTLADASLFIDELGADAEEAFKELCEALEKFPVTLNELLAAGDPRDVD